jgi:cytochrome b
MSAAASPARWHPAIVALHWLTLLLIAFQFLIAGPMREETRDLVQRFEFYQLHKSVGLTIAAFVALRLLLRLITKPPPRANDGAPPRPRQRCGSRRTLSLRRRIAVDRLPYGIGGADPDPDAVFRLVRHPASHWPGQADL